MDFAIFVGTKYLLKPWSDIRLLIDSKLMYILML